MTIPASCAVPETSQRVASVDAFRGFVMIALASKGFGLHETATNFPHDPWWQFVGFQFEHVLWAGCAFWDLIQPAFMFLVGVSLPYSCLKRQRNGEPYSRMLGHVLWRSALLMVLGVLIGTIPRMIAERSWNWDYHLVNVLTQIGLGYPLLFLMLGQPRREQWLFVVLVLTGYWGWFASYPLPEKDFDPATVGVPENWEHHLTGFARHWDKNTNAGAAADRVLLNALPRYQPFKFNSGGYATLNFVPSLITMLFGLMTGEFLQRTTCQMHRVGWLIGAGCAALAVGLALELCGICPLVKRLWTPSWAVYCTGWTLLLLAGFHLVADVWKWSWVCHPLRIAGMNSILLYLVSQAMSRWYGTGKLVERWLADDSLARLYAPLIESCGVGLGLWIGCWLLYRGRIFVRI